MLPFSLHVKDDYNTVGAKVSLQNSNYGLIFFLVKCTPHQKNKHHRGVCMCLCACVCVLV